MVKPKAKAPKRSSRKRIPVRPVKRPTENWVPDEEDDSSPDRIPVEDLKYLL